MPGVEYDPYGMELDRDLASRYHRTMDEIGILRAAVARLRAAQNHIVREMEYCCRRIQARERDRAWAGHFDGLDRGYGELGLGYGDDAYDDYASDIYGPVGSGGSLRTSFRPQLPGMGEPYDSTIVDPLGGLSARATARAR